MLQKILDGRTDLVFKWVKTSEAANMKDAHGISLIKYCAYYGDVSAIRWLLHQGATLTDLGNNYDLNGAAFHGHWQLCQFLLEQGAEANLANPEHGETPLHNCLCKANQPASNYIISLLLNYGADPNAQTIPHRETGGFMRNVYTKGETPLHRAAAFGNVASLNLLLQAGADKSVEDINGETPIGWASWHLRPGEIIALLTHGLYQIHPSHVEQNLSDHGFGWASGMETNLLGKLHLK